MKKNQFETLLYSVVGIVAMFVIIVAANLVSVSPRRASISRPKSFTPSHRHEEILSKLDGPVEIRYYVTEGEKDMPLNLKGYAERVEIAPGV